MAAIERSHPTPPRAAAVKDASCSPARSPVGPATSTRGTSPNKYTFTPKHVARIPRAWERTPVTPFVPRTHARKIWKRVPLQETKTTSTEWNAGTAGRAVKRMRPDQSLLDAQMENDMYICTKWEDPLGSVERKRPMTESKGSLESEVDFLAPAGSDQTEQAMSSADVTSDSMILQEETSENNEASSEPEKISDSVMELEHSSVADDPAPMTPGEPSHLQIEDIHPHDRECILSQSVPTNGLLLNRQEAAPPDDHMETPRHQDLMQTPTRAGRRRSGEPSEPITCPAENSDEAHDHVTVTVEAEGEVPNTLPQKTVSEFAQQGHVASDVGLTRTVAPPEVRVDEIASPPPDENAFLQDFINRARAQKAVKPPASPQKSGQDLESPARRTRQALAAHDTTALSPTKCQRLTAKERVESFEADGTAEAASSPTRQSVRLRNTTRLPRPQKARPSIPSTIPLKRANGTEFVFLQRTEAQEMAITTRLNTKKNKEGALLPRFKLEAMKADGPPSPVTAAGKKGGKKEVSWNEQQLEQFGDQPQDEESEGAAEETQTAPEATPDPAPASVKSPTRKGKRRGTANGTPAPKRRSDASASDPSIRRTRAMTRI